MSVSFVRSAVIKPGKFAAARANAEAMRKYFKSKTGLDISLATQIGGPTGAVAMRVTYDDFDQTAKVVGEMEQDAEMQRLTDKAAPMFVEGWGTDTLWRED